MWVDCRYLSGKSIARPKVLFPRVTRNDLDRDISNLVKYLFNFAFYKFGVEVTLIMMALLITIRLDAVAVLYAIWLCILFGTSRETKYHIWPILQFFIVILIVIQYIAAVGLPPFLCVGRLNAWYFNWVSNEPPIRSVFAKNWLKITYSIFSVSMGEKFNTSRIGVVACTGSSPANFVAHFGFLIAIVHMPTDVRFSHWKAIWK